LNIFYKTLETYIAASKSCRSTVSFFTGEWPIPSGCATRHGSFYWTIIGNAITTVVTSWQSNQGMNKMLNLFVMIVCLPNSASFYSSVVRGQMGACAPGRRPWESSNTLCSKL